eukprot:g15439.t1
MKEAGARCALIGVDTTEKNQGEDEKTPAPILGVEMSDTGAVFDDEERPTVVREGFSRVRGKFAHAVTGNACAPTITELETWSKEAGQDMSPRLDCGGNSELCGLDVDSDDDQDGLMDAGESICGASFAFDVGDKFPVASEFRRDSRAIKIDPTAGKARGRLRAWLGSGYNSGGHWHCSNGSHGVPVFCRIFDTGNDWRPNAVHLNGRRWG